MADIQTGINTRTQSQTLRIDVFPKPDFWPTGRRYTAASYHLAVVAGVDARALADALCDGLSETCIRPQDWAGHAGAFVADVTFAPGVTDNRARTAMEALRAAGFADQVYQVFTGRLYMVASADDAASLFNPLIERCQIKSLADFIAQGFVPMIAQVNIAGAGGAVQVNLDGSDEALVEISRRGIVDPASGKGRGPLGLSLEDMKAIRDHFAGLGRAPTDIELETLAQSWSEHCKHRIFSGQIDDIKDGIFKHYIARATHQILARPDKQDFCLSVFHDNAGAIVFDDQWMVSDKVETHNSPSALDPYGGAMTGVVGVNRDCLGFGMGAKPIANRYGFCLANPDDDSVLYRDPTLTSKLPSAQAIEAGVIRGIEDGGNQSGIPTTQGFFVHDPRYRGKPLVFAGTVGLLPRHIATKDGRTLAGQDKRAQVGDRIVMVGGRVGQDGIHGATFSSVALDSDSPATAVQIGDPITQKRMSDVIVYELRDQGLYSAITDNGAGGLSSSIGEMAEDTGGAAVHLDLVPTKYPGLSPWEIWISESQERMSLAVPPKHLDAVIAAFRRRDVEATDIGEFTASGNLELTWHGRALGTLSMAFLHDGAPKKIYTSRRPAGMITGEKPTTAPASVPDPASVSEPAFTFQQAAETLLASPTLNPRQDVAQLYDHEVQSTSVVKPLVGPGRQRSDATVIAPVAGSSKAIGMSHALYPWMTEIDPYRAATLAVDTAVRNLVAVGVDPHRIALQDNFCWCSAEEPERLWQLKEAARGCYDAAVHFGAPYISGKDSMFNDFKGYDAQGQDVQVSALPTLLISSLGIVADVANVQTLDFKCPGDGIYLTRQPGANLNGSLVARALAQTLDIALESGEQPAFDLSNMSALGWTPSQFASVAAIGAGGVFQAIVKAARAGQLGAIIDTSAFDVAQWFADGEGGFLVSSPRQVEGAIRIGEVTATGNIRFGDLMEVAI